MNTGIFLLLGSNQGDRASNLLQAQQFISRCVGPILNKSTIYQTAAWGKTDQAEFFNQVLQIATGLTPQSVLEKILTIEKDMGRTRDIKWGERLIDIDILLFNDEVIDSYELTIPHPQLQNRRFTLIPLSEIGADINHPVLHKKIKQLLLECADELPVIPLKD